MATDVPTRKSGRGSIDRAVENMLELYVVQCKVSSPPCIYWGFALRAGHGDTVWVWYCNIERDASVQVVPRVDDSIVWKGLIWSAARSNVAAASQRAGILSAAMGPWREGSLAWFHQGLRSLAENDLISPDNCRRWIQESKKPLTPITIDSHLVLPYMLVEAGLQDLEHQLLRHITGYLTSTNPGTLLVRALTAIAQGHHTTTENAATGSRSDATHTQADLFIGWEAQPTVAGERRQYIPVFTWRAELDPQMKNAKLAEFVRSVIALMPPLDPMHARNDQADTGCNPSHQVAHPTTADFVPPPRQANQSAGQADTTLLLQVGQASDLLNSRPGPHTSSNPVSAASRPAQRRKFDHGASRRSTQTLDPNHNRSTCVIPSTTPSTPPANPRKSSQDRRNVGWPSAQKPRARARMPIESNSSPTPESSISWSSSSESSGDKSLRSRLGSGSVGSGLPSPRPQRQEILQWGAKGLRS